MNERRSVEEPGGADRTGSRPGGPRVLDLAALVVGYGLAALAVRTLWPAGVSASPAVSAVVLLMYAWLGLAMSGPFVLLRRPGPTRDDDRDAPRRPRRSRVGQPLVMPAEPPPRYTRAEAAWLLIGAYWIAAVVLVIPTRLPSRGASILGLLPVLAAGLLRGLGPRRSADQAATITWTHHVAVGLLWTWPLAWIALILLSLTFG